MFTSNHMPFAMSSPVVHRVPKFPSIAALGADPATDDEATQLARGNAVSPELPLEDPLATPLLVPLADPLLVPLAAPLLEPLAVPLLEPLPPPPPEL
jgi:hypothetical protein